MTSNDSPSFQEVSLGPQSPDYHRLNRRESHDNSNVPLPSENIQHEYNGYSPLNEAEQPHQPSTTATEGQQSQRLSEIQDPETASLHSAIKKYNHRESRKFLLRTGFNRLCITASLCLIIGLTLRAYEGFDRSRPHALNNSDVRTFNVIMLSLSLALGLNLASSLKHYGLLLRWTILTRRYISLQAFDLILGCENLTSVFKLMVISFPGIDKIPYLKFPCWRQKTQWRGLKYTWLICLAWLLTNVGAQVLVATLSLFWPVDTLDNMPLTGSVSISNLATWQANSLTLQLSSANFYGMSGSQYPVSPKTNADEILATIKDISIFKGDGYYEYQFLDRIPGDQSSAKVASSRTVQSRATCTQFNFGEGSGKLVNGTTTASVSSLTTNFRQVIS